MPPHYSIQHRAQPGIQRYYYMQMTRPINRGDEILQEQPLADLLISLVELRDETMFMVPGVERNGLQALQEKYDAMSDKDQQRFMGRQNAHTGTAQTGNAQFGNDILGCFKTNACTEEEKFQGHNFHVLRVSDKTSKANHSCRPNAVLSYDFETGMGSPRALSNIDQNQEIFINYRATEEFTLSSKTIRMYTLRDSYVFECNCPACSMTGRPPREDNENRSMALQLFRQISSAYPPYVSDQATDNDLKQRRQ